jgi:hypothetical protein
MLLIFFGTECHVELLLHCDYVLYFDMLFHKILLVSVVLDIRSLHGAGPGSTNNIRVWVGPSSTDNIRVRVG